MPLLGLSSMRFSRQGMYSRIDIVSQKDVELFLRGPLVRRTAEEPLFNGLLEHYHFLGYTQPVGEHLKYLVYGAGRGVACLAWSSAPRHLGPRDRFLRWRAEARRRNIRFTAYNDFDPAVGSRAASGIPHSRSDASDVVARLGA